MLSFNPLTYRVRKRIGTCQGLAAAASQVCELHPEERGECRPAFSLPDQLDRVRATQLETNIEFEIKRVRRGEVVHAPTLAYRIDNACLVEGVLYGGYARYSQQSGQESLLPRWVDTCLPDCALPSSIVGDRYFGHFIADDACTALLAGRFAPAYFTRRNITEWPHAQRYLQLYGLELPLLWSARIQRAWVFQDFGMNQFRRKRLEQMRTRIRALPGRRSGHGVFIRRRGGGAARLLANEEALEKRLEQEGFEIVDPVSETADNIVQRIRDAAIVCGVEGSALVHGVLAMAEGASLICIQHPYRFNNVWKDYMDALEMRYGYIVGEGTRHAFTVSADDLLRTVELATASTRISAI